MILTDKAAKEKRMKIWNAKRDFYNIWDSIEDNEDKHYARGIVDCINGRSIPGFYFQGIAFECNKWNFKSPQLREWKAKILKLTEGREF